MFLASLTFAKADYYIDDTNSSVQYTGSWASANPSNPPNIVYTGNNSAETIDLGRVNNGTL
jgi:hypothetical protein